VDPLIQLFLNHLKIDKGASGHTLSSYGRDLNQFLGLDADLPLLKRKEEHIQTYLKSLKRKKLQSTSIARKTSAIKQFYKFLIREELITEDPSLFIEAPVLPKKLPKAIDESVLMKLLEAADQGLPYEGDLADSLRARDRAMIYLLYATGVRVSELLGIECSRIDLEAMRVRVFGKRSKERIIPFAPVAADLVRDYLILHRPSLKPNSDILFLGQGGTPLTRQAFWKTLKRIATLAAIPGNLHPHMLRHTFASDLLRSGMNLRSLQSLLGHSDLQTTQIYTHVVPETLKEVIDRYHPRGKK
jgi:integrase/recombinase XerD